MGRSLSPMSGCVCGHPQEGMHAVYAPTGSHSKAAVFGAITAAGEFLERHGYFPRPLRHGRHLGVGGTKNDAITNHTPPNSVRFNVVCRRPPSRCSYGAGLPCNLKLLGAEGQTIMVPALAPTQNGGAFLLLQPTPHVGCGVTNAGASVVAGRPARELVRQVV